ncbi:MAG: ATP-binding protein, partial [Chloroflexi bacterium]|nr:ATP-binding protein [Chloroflexota bacterium]
AEPTDVECDGERVAQVITNLVGNSLKFAPRGSVITVSTRVTPEALLVSTVDEGPGIPQDQLTSIFQPFARIIRAGEGTTTGAGLGLAIATGIIEQHGGTISASNGEFGGAVFTFSLPLAQRA